MLAPFNPIFSKEWSFINLIEAFLLSFNAGEFILYSFSFQTILVKASVGSDKSH